jgi:transcriptional regulator with XRE-family HTH domain
MPKQPEVTVTAASEVVGTRVRELRHSRGQSVDELARAAVDAGHPELTRDAVYAIESGRRLDGRRRRTVSVDELLAFAEVLGVPVFELLPAVAPSNVELRTEFKRRMAYAEELLSRMSPSGPEEGG